MRNRSKRSTTTCAPALLNGFGLSIETNHVVCRRLRQSTRRGGQMRIMAGQASSRTLLGWKLLHKLNVFLALIIVAGRGEPDERRYFIAQCSAAGDPKASPP